MLQELNDKLKYVRYSEYPDNKDKIDQGINKIELDLKDYYMMSNQERLDAMNDLKILKSL